MPKITSRMLNITGMQFGLLTVLQFKGFKKFRTTRSPVWMCKCECGTIKHSLRSSDLRSGRTISCGCHKKAMASKIKTTHGHTVKTKSKEYIAWSAM
jgi:hypothetical protein